MGVRTCSSPTAMSGLVAEILNALGTLPTAALLYPLTVKLFVNDIHVSRNSALTDFTEATFPGYAPVIVAGPAKIVSIDANNDGVVADANFDCNAVPTAGQTCYGFFAEAGATPTLMLAERFDTPVPIAAAGDYVALTVLLPEPYLRVSTPS